MILPQNLWKKWKLLMWHDSLNHRNHTRWCLTKTITLLRRLFVKHFTNSNFRMEFAINKVEAAAPTRSRFPMKSSRNVTLTGCNWKRREHERSFNNKQFYAAFNFHFFFISIEKRKKSETWASALCASRHKIKAIEIKRKTFQTQREIFLSL